MSPPQMQPAPHPNSNKYAPIYYDEDSLTIASQCVAPRCPAAFSSTPSLHFPSSTSSGSFLIPSRLGNEHQSTEQNVYNNQQYGNQSAPECIGAIKPVDAEQQIVDDSEVFHCYALSEIPLHVARRLLDTNPIFEAQINNISPALVRETRDAGHVPFKSYLHLVAAYFANLHGDLLDSAIVAADPDVSNILFDSGNST